MRIHQDGDTDSLLLCHRLGSVGDPEWCAPPRQRFGFQWQFVLPEPQQLIALPLALPSLCAVEKPMAQKLPYVPVSGLFVQVPDYQIHLIRLVCR